MTNTYIKDKVAECNSFALADAEQLPLDGEERAFISGAGQRRGRLPSVDAATKFREQRQCRKLQPESALQRDGVSDRQGESAETLWTRARAMRAAMPDSESVLRYFNDHGHNCWDHFTTAGQFEGVNPSNAMTFPNS